MVSHAAPLSMQDQPEDIHAERQDGSGCLIAAHSGVQGQPQDIHAERQDAGEVEEPLERDAEGNKLTKKARMALLKAAERERSARRASAAERMDPEAKP